MKRPLTFPVLVFGLYAGLFATGVTPAAPSPKTHPCALITRADAARALGLQPRPGVAAPASDYAPANAPDTTCAYFGAPKGFVRVTYMGDVHDYTDFHNRMGADAIDVHGIGDAAFWIKGNGEMLHVMRHGFAFTVILHYQTGNTTLADPQAPLPQLIVLAKAGASRL